MSDKGSAEKDEREVYLYNLTGMTGKGAQDERRHVHFTIEMRRDTRNANILAIILTIIAMVVAFPVVNLIPILPIWIALIIGSVVYAVTLWMMLRRSRRGLRVAQWRAFYDRRRAQVGVFIQYGTVVDPLSSEPLVVTPAGIPNTPTQEWDPDLIIEEATA